MTNRRLTQKIKDFFELILKDPKRKNGFRILYEYGKFIITKPDIAEQYFGKFLYRKGVKNFDHYLITQKMMSKCWDLNNACYYSLMGNKHLFEVFFGKRNINVGKGLAHNLNTLFFQDNDFIQINTPDEFLNFLNTITLKTTTSKSIFIKTIVDSGGGKNIFKVTYEELLADKAKLDLIYKHVIKSGYLFQEEIVQHPDLSKINPYCLNTLRIDTFTNKQLVTKVVSCHLKVGTNKSHVDNVSSGGAYVGINLNNGTLFSEAFSDFTHGKGRTYSLHPISNIRFEGFQIPYFKEAQELAKKAAELLPQLKVIGWDVAIGPDGPIIVEGNGQPSLVFSEVGQKGFLTNSNFMEMYNEANSIL
ncbi:MAG: sugar-transfer associated ATP-grasp domain-containing protein [Lentimicrobium sp.]